jgi:biopolymer transport protein ExbD
MAMSVGSGKAPQADINMTPMIDVLLVPIIIFMVITRLTPHGLEALVPQPAPPQRYSPDPQTVVIVLEKDGSMNINQDPVQEANLQQRLKDIFKTRAERAVFVKSDPGLEFAAVAHAIDVILGAGIDKVGLMTPTTEAAR